jgi:hypothetical protein
MYVCFIFEELQWSLGFVGLTKKKKNLNVPNLLKKWTTHGIPKQTSPPIISNHLWWPENQNLYFLLTKTIF